jgi:hypothetical protein
MAQLVISMGTINDNYLQVSYLIGDGNSLNDTVFIDLLPIFSCFSYNM